MNKVTKKYKLKNDFIEATRFEFEGVLSKDKIIGYDVVVGKYTTGRGWFKKEHVITTTMFAGDFNKLFKEV